MREHDLSAPPRVAARPGTSSILPGASMDNDTPAYLEALDSLYGLQKYGIKFGLSKTSNLLEAFGRPQDGQAYVHIAGTNGKGSVAAFLSSMLMEAGFKVGVYTSPHLVRFTERIRINGVEIPRGRALELMCMVKDAMAASEPPTFFEAVTAMALKYFADERTDVALMEVGMGGRLDATNVISPMVSVITNISKEHEAFLGARLADIAREKAGIIKEDTEVVTAVTQPAVVRVVEEVARKKRAPVIRLGRDVTCRVTGSGMHYRGRNRTLHGLEPGLKGFFQGRNAAVALAALEVLETKGFASSPAHMRAGISKAGWWGRMHLVASNPPVMVDGAHNPGAMKTLAIALKKDFSYRKLILVIGIMADKDIGRMLRLIVPQADYVVYTRPVYDRAADAERLAAEGASLGTPWEVVTPLGEAVDRARAMAGPDDLVVVCGSLFTVGEAVSHLDPDTFRPDGG